MNPSADNGSDSTPTVWEQTVAALTRATREQVELGELLATALAAAAANAGSRDRLPLRTGSWEGAHVEGLLDGMLGSSRAGLWRDVDLTWRTEPITVPLDVAHLVSEHNPDHDLDTAAERLVPWPDTDKMSDEDALAAQERHDQDYGRLLAQTRRDYEAYAERFTTAVHQIVAATPDLLDVDGRPRVPVAVPTHTDPNKAPAAEVTNPNEYDSDPVVWQLWSQARERAGLPPAPEQPSNDETGAPPAS